MLCLQIDISVVGWERQQAVTGLQNVKGCVCLCHLPLFSWLFCGSFWSYEDVIKQSKIQSEVIVFYKTNAAGDGKQANCVWKCSSSSSGLLNSSSFVAIWSFLSIDKIVMLLKQLVFLFCKKAQKTKTKQKWKPQQNKLLLSVCFHTVSQDTKEMIASSSISHYFTCPVCISICWELGKRKHFALGHSTWEVH